MLRHLIAAATLAATVLLTGCTTTAAIKEAVAEAQAENAGADGLQAVLEFTVTDIEAAHALAVAADDKPAMQCWPAMHEWVAHLAEYRGAAELAEAATDGIFVKYQRARAVRRRLGSGVPEEVEIACAAMVDESSNFLKRLLVRLGAG